MSTIRPLLAACAAVLLGACASAGPAKAPAADAGNATALERSVVRWQAIIEGRAGDAWDLLTPGVRSTKTREAYAQEWAQKPLRYVSVAPVDEICDADACTVTVELEYDVQIPLAGVGAQRAGAVLDERWVRVDGAWYYLPAAYR